MKENRYDDGVFFEKYSSMPRSLEGLRGAGEWHVLKGMLSDFKGKKVLDLGCGFGWHCAYAAENGASYVLGLDISAKMIQGARERNPFQNVHYRQLAIEDYDYPEEEFDIVISSLAFHYLRSFDDIAAKVYRSLKHGGRFVFSVEHPVFTAYGSQDWIYDNNGEKLLRPLDRYFYEGPRNASFLGEEILKYHRTVTSYINGTLEAGFIINEVVEPQPFAEAIKHIPGMADEMRRPIFLIISATKK